jgi:hypothetical protein
MCRPLRGWERGEDSLFLPVYRSCGAGENPVSGGTQFYRCVAPYGAGKEERIPCSTGIPILRGWGKPGFGGTQFYRYTAPTGLKNGTGFFALPVYRSYEAGENPVSGGGRKSTDVSPPTGLGKRRGFLAPTGIPILRSWGKTRFRGNAILPMCRPLRGWERGEDSLFLPVYRSCGAEEWNGILCTTDMTPLRGWE